MINLNTTSHWKVGASQLNDDITAPFDPHVRPRHPADELKTILWDKVT